MNIKNIVVASTATMVMASLSAMQNNASPNMSVGADEVVPVKKDKSSSLDRFSKNVEGVLEPVMVSAMRFADSIYDLPVNASAISAEKISDSDLVSVSQVLNRHTDVYFRNTGGGIFMQQPSLRGFGVNSQSRVLVVLDGQRLNNIDMAGINWGQIQTSDIENIEVLYGAQTATYGNYAESGVIKISTKKWDKNGGTFGATYGEYGEYSFYGTANYSTDDYYVSASANYFHDSGFFENSLTWNKSATLNAGLKLDDKNELGFYANVGNMFVSWPGYIYATDVSSLESLYPNGLSHDEEDRVDYMTMAASWENKTLQGEGAAHLGLNIRDKAIDWVGNRTVDSTLYTISFDPKYRFYLGKDDESYFEAGVDFNYDHLDATAPEGQTSGAAYVSDIDRYTVSPWMGGKAQLDEIFSLTASARYEAVINNAKTDTKEYTDPWGTNPAYNYNDSELVQGLAAQIGFNAKLDDNWNLYARFDQIYHYASIDERYSLWGIGSTYTNHTLDPEHGQNYEIGVNFAKSGLSFNTSLFYMHLNDEIAYNKLNGLNDNIGDTNRYGIQARLAYNYEDVAGAYTSWTFVDAKYASGADEGEKVAIVPDIVSKSGVWVKPVKYVMAELNFIWTSEQFQEGYLDTYGSKVKIPQSYSLDLTVNFYPCDYARVFLAVSNLTNHINCTYATYNCWYVDAGRTIRCGVELRF